MSVVERAWELQSAGAERITLNDLGGAQSVLDERADILASQELSVVVTALVDELDEIDDPERAEGIQLCLEAAGVDDAITLLEITDDLVTSPVILAEQAQQLDEALRRHAEQRSDAAGGLCLEGVVRLALGGWTSAI